MTTSIEVELLFKNADGKRKTFNILDPKEDLTMEVAKKAMGDIIAANIFNILGSDLKTAEDARKRTTTLEKLA
jgi:hypothetical protein